jgi:hypothetical protein
MLEITQSGCSITQSGCSISVGRVRELKGAPLAVLALLAIFPLPVSKEWLARSSGYTDKPIQMACQYLLEQGMVDRSRSGWFLAQDLRRSLIRNFSDSISIIKDLEDSVIDLDVNTNTIKRNNSDCLISAAQNSDSQIREKPQAEVLEIWRILAAAGIRRNERTEALLSLEHITPDYLQSKIAEFEAKGLCGNKWTGLIIRALEAGEPAPERSENGHVRDCDCVTCKVNKFMGR